VLLLILVGKSLIALAVVLLLGYPLSTALMVSAALAQIGEFSFILAGLGISYGLLPKEGLSLILAGAILSITINKLTFIGADLITRWVRAEPGRRRAFGDARDERIGELQAELDAAHERAAQKAALHRTLSPEELVQRFPLFTKLTPEQREVVILHFLPQSAQPGERIIRKGDKADAAYFVSSGDVEVAIDGRRIHLGPGSFFGEMALISGQPRSAHVTALDYCNLLKLTTRDFAEIMRRYPEIRVQVEEMAAQRDAMNRVQAATAQAKGAAAQG
jgi:CPA2 family monovalent cation:H+ antiporter-2